MKKKPIKPEVIESYESFAEKYVRYRVGRKVGNTLYLGDTFIGSCVSPEAAAQLVAAANRGNR